MVLFQNCSDGQVRLPQGAKLSSLAIRAINPIRANQDETVELTIQGENFDEQTAVQVGGVFCQNVTIQSNTSLTCQVGPVSDLGTVDVQVIRKNGDRSPSSLFEWYALTAEEKCRLPEYVTTSQVPVNFGAQNNQCDFGNGGNGNAAQGQARARVRQDFTLNIPANSAVCGVQFDFPLQTFRYDDDIAFTFGNVLLMTSLGQAVNGLTLLNGSNYLRTYNWNGFLGTTMNNRTPYCAGQDQGFTTCSIPPSDQQANFSLNINPEVFTDILNSGNGGDNKFSFITIGDNDVAVDCKHSGLNFTATVRYVQR